jgi:hypothetical protein
MMPCRQGDRWKVAIVLGRYWMGPGRCHWSVSINLRVHGITYLHEYVTNLSLQGEYVSHDLLCTSDVVMSIQKAVQLQWKIESMSVSNLPRCQQSSMPQCCSTALSQKISPLTSRVGTDAVQEVQDVDEHDHRRQTQVELALKGFLIVKELFFRHCLRNGDSCETGSRTSRSAPFLFPFPRQTSCWRWRLMLESSEDSEIV